MKYKIPFYTCYRGLKKVLEFEVTSHCIHNRIDYISLFFTVDKSSTMALLEVDKIVIDNVFVGKEKYKVSLKLKLPKKIAFYERFPSISCEFNRMHKKFACSVIQDSGKIIEFKYNQMLEII